MAQKKPTKLPLGLTLALATTVVVVVGLWVLVRFSHAPEKPMETTKLKIETLKQGTGAEAKNGDTVEVHYTGTLTDGSKFDSSLDRGSPFSFKLGAGQVIAGWDQGIVGMKVGEKRRLTIPPDLGYGARRTEKIPPNSTLIFEVELLKIN